MKVFADTVYYNGSILTMNDEQKFAEAVAVHDETIMAVGDLQQVKQYADNHTKYFDLQGKTLLPGFIDVYRS